MTTEPPNADLSGVLHTVHVWLNEARTTLSVLHGTNLRQALLKAGLSPYGALSRFGNCGGRGICATCGVRFSEGEPAPVHWHDRLAARYGYPRLSCQIAVTGDMTIRLLTDKVMWGKREQADRFAASGDA
jgi:ferredoxin